MLCPVLEGTITCCCISQHYSIVLLNPQQVIPINNAVHTITKFLLQKDFRLCPTKDLNLIIMLRFNLIAFYEGIAFVLQYIANEMKGEWIARKYEIQCNCRCAALGLLVMLLLELTTFLTIFLGSRNVSS